MLEKNEESSPAVRHTHTYSCFVPFGVLLLFSSLVCFLPIRALQHQPSHFGSPVILAVLEVGVTRHSGTE